MPRENVFQCQQTGKVIVIQERASTKPPTVLVTQGMLTGGPYQDVKSYVADLVRGHGVQGPAVTPYGSLFHQHRKGTKRLI